MSAKKKSIIGLVMFIAVMSITLIATEEMLRAGQLTPSAPPGSTMKTLDEIYQKLDAIANQQIPLPTGFVLWSANPRFAVWDPNTPSDPNDDMVLDRSTGLMWTRNANLPNGTMTWQDAITYCDNLIFPDLNYRQDWRLPSIEELTTLTEPYPSTHNPALPAGHPFVNVQSNPYWSSVEVADDPALAWNVATYNGGVWHYFKYISICVWPVRGPQ